MCWFTRIGFIFLSLETTTKLVAASNPWAPQFRSSILVMGLFAVFANIAFKSLILVLLPCREIFRVQSEPMIESYILTLSWKIKRLCHETILVHSRLFFLFFILFWFGFFLTKCSCCDLLLQIRKRILPSFYDIMAIVNCSQVSWCRWPCEDKH